MDEHTLIAHLIIILVVIYATSLHELAHAYVATKLGDPTPGLHGRLTWNPIPHLSPFLSAVVFPIVIYISSGMLFILAQTPINPSKFKRPIRDQALVAVAGPITNFIFAAVLYGILRIPRVYGFDGASGEEFYTSVVMPRAAFWIMFLGIFNLMPLPPLDGYWIVRGLFPIELRRQADALARSPMAFFVVIIFGSLLIGYVIGPIKQFHNFLLPPYHGY